MPNLKLIDNRAQLPQARYQQATPEEYGAGTARALGHMGDVFERIQAAEEATESHRLVGEGLAAIKGGLQEAEQTFADPEEFKAAADKAIKDSHEGTLARATNPRVKARVGAALADNVGLAQIDAKGKYFGKKKDKALADFDITTEAMTRAAAATTDDETRKGFYQSYGELLGELRASGFLTEQGMVNKAQEFDKKVLKNQFYNELEANPSAALNGLKTERFGKLDAETRRQYTTHANTAIREGITAQERELKLEREKADLQVQKLIDAGASPTQIQDALRRYTAAGIYGGDEREKWEARLLKQSMRDTPEQFNNAETLMTNFKREFYTPNRVAQVRAQTKQMETAGDIGPKGAGQMYGFLNQVQQALIREGRAAASEARAEENRGKGPKTTDTQAKQIIGENYPYDKPGTLSKMHKDDIARYNDRPADADRAEVARKIRDDRSKVIREKKQQTNTINTLSPGEAAAMKALQGKK